MNKTKHLDTNVLRHFSLKAFISYMPDSSMYNMSHPMRASIKDTQTHQHLCCFPKPLRLLSFLLSSLLLSPPPNIFSSFASSFSCLPLLLYWFTQMQFFIHPPTTLECAFGKTVRAKLERQFLLSEFYLGSCIRRIKQHLESPLPTVAE